MRKVYLAFITIITVFCIIIGSYRNLMMFRSDNNEEYIEESAPEEWSDYPEEHTWEFGEINAVEADLEFGNVYIYEGPNMIEVQNPDFIEYEVADGVLKIKQNPGYKNHWDDVQNDSALTDVYIYIEGSSRITELSVSIKAGSFAMSGLSPQTLNVTCDLGDIRADNISIGNGNITAKMGNVELDMISFGNLTVKEQMGNIYISSVDDLAEYKKDFSVKLGVLTVNGSNIGRSVTSDGTGGEFVVTNEMGDIEINWNM